MRKATLGYPLIEGYIHHWLVAGPQVIPVEGFRQPSDSQDRLQIIRQYHQPGPGVDGKPIEYGECRIGQVKEKWRYVRTRHDHQVDLSAFHPVPCFLRAWAYTEIESPMEQDVTFLLTTTGPADLWINDQHVHRQEHFHDRIPSPVLFQSHLQSGINRLMVRFEQVGVRECPYSLALQVVGIQAKAETKIVRIPTAAPSLSYRQKLETLFEDCHIRQDVYTRKDQIIAYLPEGKLADTPFNIRMQTPSGSIFAEARRDGRHTEPQQPMGFPFQSPQGSYQLRFMPPPREFYEQGVRITRARDFYASTNIYSTQPYGTYAERRIECLKDAARRKNLFGEIAKMEAGWWKDVDEKVVLKAIEEVRSRAANADIQLCGLLSMLYRYADRESFPVSLRQPIEECVLGFRYWEDEPGSDAMDYHSESHSILFHTCEILAGQQYRERLFTNSSQTGQWHIEKVEQLALAWLQKRASDGFEEWDSGFEEIVLALSTLASLAENSQIFELAALVLDKIFFTMAVNSFKGVFGSTHGRTHSLHIKTGCREPTAGISRLLWGMGIFNEHILGSVSLACSTYELPPVIAAIAADQPAELWSKEQHAGVNKVTYKTPDGMLCSAQDWHSGKPGHREHIWQATLSPIVTVFTSHPACASEGTSRGPNYWHGNASLPRVAQWKDTLIAIYSFADDDWMDFTHAYFPVHGMDEYQIRAGWAFGKGGSGYIALTASQGLDFQTCGDSAYRELRSPGTPNIWLCQMGRTALDGSFNEFIEKILALPVKFNEDQVELIALRGDQLHFGWEGPLLLNDEPLIIDNFKHYDNFYCACEAGAPIMEIKHGGDVLRLHFEGQELKTDS
ncbi:MAG TPA: hypothetical protein VFQ13_07130 [Anaerolineales bacterium]|nr:hypothetical protein [Anaerolineales bacterium]